MNVTAPPLRLSGGSPDSRSGDADEALVGNEAALGTLLSSERKHLLRSPSLQTVMAVSAGGRKHQQRVLLAVVLGSVRTSSACDATDYCTPYNVWTFLDSCVS